ncbi:SRPBCC family protein [Saccharopolyspora taberi]|uniref:SRPBCC family protein n=1 Tax=Saccharopolyspora taberi TaxID=60895 RepID=A0ABN3VK78_9PSEU
MAKSYASAVIPASVDAVWSVVREFNGLPEWHPGVEHSEIEGGGEVVVGCIRALRLADGAPVREQLTHLDDLARSTGYEMLEGPFPIRRYLATVRLAPVTDTGQTFAEWWVDFDAEAADEPELVRTLAGTVFAPGLAALRERFAG